MDDLWRAVFFVFLLLAALGGWLGSALRRNLGRSLRLALAWAMIFLGVVALYGLRDEISQALLPAQSQTATTLTLPRAGDGHYYAELTIGDQEIPFMIDTGASDVVLAPDAARSLGFDPARMAFTGSAMTANGRISTARVVLPDLTFGPFEDTGVAASITTGEMDVSLLGMSYLGGFDITIAGGKMVLSRPSQAATEPSTGRK
jgi:aspartyl protease family protein